MNYYSTRDHQHIVSATQAIACGLAPDGGLFVPEALPGVSAQQLQALCGMTYQQRAVTIMRPFLSEFTDEELARFTAAAYGSQFDDPAVAPVHRLDDTTAFLELWHGPTCAFKDMALQILPYLLTASLKKVRRAAAGVHPRRHLGRHRQGGPAGLCRRAGHEDPRVLSLQRRVGDPAPADGHADGR